MPTSVPAFEAPDSVEVDQLIDSLLYTLHGVFPTGGLRGMDDDRLLVATGSIERLGRAVDALRVEAAGEVGHRSRSTLGTGSLAVQKGCRDAVELMRRVTLASTGTVRRQIKLGAETRVQEALSGDLFPPRFSHIASGLAAGQLGVDAATAIIAELAPTLTRADGAAVSLAEAELVSAATGNGNGTDSPVACTADEIRAQATVWRVFLDQDGTEPTETKAMARRAFSPGSYNSGDGLVHGRYALMPEVHGKLGKVFDACLTPKTGPAFLPEGDTGTETGEAAGTSRQVDPRTADQQRHDVFAAMVDGFARSGQAPTIGGASPTVLVSITQDDLESGTGAGFVSLGGPGGETVPISLRTVRQMICTGGTQLVTLDKHGAIIELGTEQRCFTPAQRRAITLRDGGCIIPGCTIPAASAEIHHITPDAAGGPTHTNNGVLLCWFHHRTIDTSGWEIRMINKVPHVKAPPWLAQDNQWHPATKSPTRKIDRLRKRRRGREKSERVDGASGTAS